MNENLTPGISGRGDLIKINFFFKKKTKNKNKIAPRGGSATTPKVPRGWLDKFHISVSTPLKEEGGARDLDWHRINPSMRNIYLQKFSVS
jgi:hypothetical protein